MGLVSKLKTSNSEIDPIRWSKFEKIKEDGLVRIKGSTFGR
jgi:hypothetical protein